MAVRRRSFRRRRRQRVIWTDIGLAQASLPTVLLDELVPVDGAFSALRRYEGTDLTVKRTIVDTAVTITSLADPVNANTMLELCIGLSWFDSMKDVDGKGVNSSISAGTGPVDDINNSRWFVRCCVLIPLGQLIVRVPSGANDNGLWVSNPMGGYLVLGAAANTRKITWYCHIDTKAQRRQQGQETEWLNVALQARVASGDLAAGDDVSVIMDAFRGRQVLAIK